MHTLTSYHFIEPIEYGAYCYQHYYEYTAISITRRWILQQLCGNTDYNLRCNNTLLKNSWHLQKLYQLYSLYKMLNSTFLFFFFLVISLKKKMLYVKNENKRKLVCVVWRHDGWMSNLHPRFCTQKMDHYSISCMHIYVCASVSKILIFSCDGTPR